VTAGALRGGVACGGRVPGLARLTVALVVLEIPGLARAVARAVEDEVLAGVALAGGGAGGALAAATCPPPRAVAAAHAVGAPVAGVGAAGAGGLSHDEAGREGENEEQSELHGGGS
jgi:hypothetical protein